MNRGLHPAATESQAERAPARGGWAAEEALLQRWEPLARHLAHRFAAAAEREDLEQVARLGLLTAARRFDPARGCQFQTFAVPTILGQLRRYLRDQEPAIRIPARWWDLHLPLQRARESLAQALGREPTVAELAARLEVSEEDVAGAISAEEFYRLKPLDEPWVTSGEGEAETVAERLGRTDPRLVALEEQIALQQMVERLPAPLPDVVRRRYFQGASQQEVARDLGVSQMQISRLERRALAQLREALRGEGELQPEAPG